jgi:hypothetical protein
MNVKLKNSFVYLYTIALVAIYLKEMNTTISVTTYKKIFLQCSCWNPLFLAFWQFKLINLFYLMWKAYNKNNNWSQQAECDRSCLI